MALVVMSLTACHSKQNNVTEIEEVATQKYTVQFEIECQENWIFSRYDVNVLVDGELLGTIEHGSTGTYTTELEEGEHTLKVEKEDDINVDGTIEFTVPESADLFYTLSLSSDQVKIEEKELEQDLPQNETESINSSDVEKQEPEEDVEDSGEEILTIDNCAEFAEILSLKDEFDPTIAKFAAKYQGRVIEFDGNVAYVSPHGDYNTRFDYLICGGDYSETTVSGPNFQFENVNYYNLNLKGDNVPETFDMGLNIHVIAEIDRYDSATGLFKLKPIEITMR